MVRNLKGSERYVSYMDDTTPGFGIRVGLRSKTWTVVRGRNRERLTIGKYPDLSLAEARAEAKRLLSTEPEAKALPKTFKEAREEFLEANYTPGSRTKYQVKRSLELHLRVSNFADWPTSTTRTLSGRSTGLWTAPLNSFTRTATGSRASPCMHVKRGSR